MPSQHDLLHYMFKNAPRDRRIEVAELAFRYNRTHYAELDLFLAAVLPLAERAARRRAERASYFSVWKFEAMYDAVTAAIEMFQHGTDLRGTEENSFRRYLLRSPRGPRVPRVLQISASEPHNAERTQELKKRSGSSNEENRVRSGISRKKTF